MASKKKKKGAVRPQLSQTDESGYIDPNSPWLTDTQRAMLLSGGDTSKTIHGNITDAAGVEWGAREKLGLAQNEGETERARIMAEANRIPPELLSGFLSVLTGQQMPSNGGGAGMPTGGFKGFGDNPGGMAPYQGPGGGWMGGQGPLGNMTRMPVSGGGYPGTSQPIMQPQQGGSAPLGGPFGDKYAQLAQMLQAEAGKTSTLNQGDYAGIAARAQPMIDARVNQQNAAMARNFSRGGLGSANPALIKLQGQNRALGNAQLGTNLANAEIDDRMQTAGRRVNILGQMGDVAAGQTASNQFNLQKIMDLLIKKPSVAPGTPSTTPPTTGPTTPTATAGAASTGGAYSPSYMSYLPNMTR